MFVKTVIRQGQKIIELNKENKALYEENKSNREDLEDYSLLQKHTRELADSVIRKLYYVQDVDHLGISEEEKQKHRNVIINKLIKQSLDIINELDSRQTYLVHK